MSGCVNLDLCVVKNNGVLDAHARSDLHISANGYIWAQL